MIWDPDCRECWEEGRECADCASTRCDAQEQARYEALFLELARQGLRPCPQCERHGIPPDQAFCEACEKAEEHFSQIERMKVC